MQVSDTDSRSLGDLFGELTGQVTALVRQEVELARVEMTEKAAQVGTGVSNIAVGGAVVYAGFIVVLLAIGYAIGQALVSLRVLPDGWLWVPAVIVGLLVTLIGYALLRRGQAALKRLDLTPRRTLQTLKEAPRALK